MSLAAICNAEPIEFVVSASPGGPNDTVTRRVVDVLEKKTNLQFVVINKPGAAHVVAYNYVSASNKPTLVFSTPEIMDNSVIHQVDEVFLAGYFSNILYVSEQSGIKQFSQLQAVSKKRVINFGHGGIGSYSHRAMEIVCKRSLTCLDVPYKSGSEGMMALMTGTIDAYALASYGSRQFLENDRYVAIYYIRAPRDHSWFKLFAKNLSNSDRAAVAAALKSQDYNFFSDMGFER
jgi:tripartite-type tricarboxylate transporter receptor subunit TctC